MYGSVGFRVGFGKGFGDCINRSFAWCITTQEESG